jgi:uncharacterized membrane protein
MVQGAAQTAVNVAPFAINPALSTFSINNGVSVVTEYYHNLLSIVIAATLVVTSNTLYD